MTVLRVVVTGAASGIGLATARRLAADGASVALLDVAESVAEAAGQIRADGGHAVAVQADLSAEVQVSAAVSECVTSLGGLTGVVANAAVQLIGQDSPVHELPIEVWDQTLAVNLTGIFLTCKHTIPVLRAAGGGSVVVTGSPTGMRGTGRGFHAYSASKAGVMGLARVMAAEYAEDGIRVNAVVPGFTDTPLVGSLMSSPEARDSILRRVPLGRPGSAAEIAAVIAFLLSAESSFVTGAVWTVDGGETVI